MSTTTGKVVVIGCAVFLLLSVLATIALVVFGFVIGKKVVDEVQLQVQQGLESTVTAGGPAPTSATTTATIPPRVPNSEVFTFRDVFEPLVLDMPAPSSDDTSGGDGADVSQDTLYLQDIVTEDGEDKAVLTYNGTEYTLAEGEGIPNTPWQVLSIGQNSVVMLYGDTQVTLSVGQGVTK